MKMKLKRNYRNKLTIDLLPPFGKPEVSLFGTIAFVGGLLIVLAVIYLWIL